MLARSLPELEAAAAALVREHLRKLGRDGENWVAEGMPRIEAASAGLDHKACPFCAQDLAGSNLIPHYQAYFSDAYNQLKADIRTLGRGIAADHGGEVMAGFERSIRDVSETRFLEGLHANSGYPRRYRRGSPGMDRRPGKRSRDPTGQSSVAVGAHEAARPGCRGSRRFR